MATNLQCSLSRSRMVFGATRRRRALPVPGRMIGAAAESSVVARKGFSIGETVSSAREHCGLPERAADVASIVASFSRKPASTSVGVAVDQRVLRRKVLVDPVRGVVSGLKVHDIGEQLLPQRRRLVWTQNNPGNTNGFLLLNGSRYGRPFLNRFDRPQSRVYAALDERSPLCWRHPAILPSPRSGASRSSSPAMPTRVKRA